MADKKSVPQKAQDRKKAQKKRERELKKKSGRDSSGKYLKGHESPGPGRPKGSLNKPRKEVEKELSEEIVDFDNIEEAEAVAYRLCQSNQPSLQAMGARLLVQIEQLRVKKPRKEKATLTPKMADMVASWVAAKYSPNPGGGPDIDEDG